MITPISQHNVALVHGPTFLNWLGHLKGVPAVGLELGTFQGESAAWMMTNIFTHPEATYYCVDTFEGSAEHQGKGVDWSALEAETRTNLSVYPQALIVKRKTAYFLQDTPDKFDFIYVDASHDALNVLRDAVLAFDCLKVGGIMIFDDYGWDVMPDERDRPKMAIDAFCAIYSRQIEELGRGWLVGLKKIHDA